MRIPPVRCQALRQSGTRYCRCYIVSFLNPHTNTGRYEFLGRHTMYLLISGFPQTYPAHSLARAHTHTHTHTHTHQNLYCKRSVQPSKVGDFQVREVKSKGLPVKPERLLSRLPLPSLLFWGLQGLEVRDLGEQILFFHYTVQSLLGPVLISGCHCNEVPQT